MQKAKQGYKLVKSLFGKYEEIPEEWEQVFLKNVTQVKGRVGWKGYAQEDFVDADEGAISLGASNISKMNQLSLKNMSYVKWEKYDESPEIQISEGDILVAQRGSIGKIAMVDQDLGKTTINPNVVLLTKFKANNLFLFYALTSNYVTKQINSIVSSTSVPLLTQGQINHFRLLLSPKPEQEKIASILSSTDELLNHYDKTIDLTKKLKIGLMQTLLTRGIGHKKFKKIKWYFGKEIEIPEEWENVDVEYVADKLLSGGTPSTIVPEYWNGGIPWTKGAVLTTNNTTSGERFISKSGLKNSSTSIIPKDNLLVVSRVSIGNISINKIDLAINQDITAIILNKSLCLTEFLYWNLLQTIAILVSFGQGTTIQGFTRKDLSIHKVLLPPLTEQQKIASILSAIDNKISDLKSKKSNLESLKKGLMQKLLTGQIRVKV